MNNNFSLIDFVTQELNFEQQQAVTPATGILLVCAGAGSGKTRVITTRIAYLIKEHKNNAQSLLALTFTNKAAREMQERVTHFLGHTRELPFVGTFHSYCLRLLKIHSHLLPFETFSLLDDDDQEKIIRKLLTRYGLTKKLSLRQVAAYISRTKNTLTSTLDSSTYSSHEKILKELFYLYEQEKAAAHCLDFDDLLTYTLTLLEKNIHFREKLQQQIRHVLVDEYQDTNHVQHALLKALTQDNTGAFALDSLCIVGDEDQSIYSWRGATVTNMLNFTSDFPQARAITIDKNYRSVQPILSLANSVIKYNSARNPKNLWSQKQAIDRIRLISCPSSYQEAELIALFLKQSAHITPLHEHAILYRSHFQSRSLEEALIRHNISYKIMGGIQFYDRQEIKDLLAYIRLIINPFDRLAFFRVINTPARGLGEKFEQQCNTVWQERPQASFHDILITLLTTEHITKSKQEVLKNFLELFKDLSRITPPTQALTLLLERINYLSYLKDQFEKEEAQTKIDNVKELISGAAYFENNNSTPTLEQFLAEIALLQEKITDQDHNYTNCVRLMTLHASKGLEFNTVILPGLEEHILPSSHALYNPETLEEERRLLYVGITRAQERLLITQARQRYAYGNTTDQRPSRFTAEFDQAHIQHDECAYWSQQQIHHYFNAWLTSSAPTRPHKTTTTAHTLILSQKSSTNATQSTTTIQWHERQRIYHAHFGQGIIEKVEQKNSTTVYLTIRFSLGLKKLDAQFVQIL